MYLGAAAMGCLQVILADNTGIVQASLWPPASRFHGVLSSALAKSSEGCFPFVKMKNFEVRVTGRFGSTQIVKLEGTDSATMEVDSEGSFQIKPVKDTYLDDFSHLLSMQAGLRVLQQV